MQAVLSGARVVRLGALVLCFPLSVVAQRATIRTVVSDIRTHLPLAGVAITGPSLAVFTDAQGRLTIDLASDTATITIRRAGYRTLRVRAASMGTSVALEPDPTLLSAVTVEATASNTLAAGTTLPVGSVSRSQIDASASPALAEAMKGIEGINVQRPGAWGGKAFVRGLGGERVAVLIDGQRVNRACTFGMDQGLAAIDPAAVERIEVLSGPGSTLYGSGNVGGVINVVTRRAPMDRPRGSEVRAATSVAVPGASLGGSYFARARNADVSLSVDAASFGDYRAPTGTVRESGLRTLSLDGKLGWLPVATQRVSLQGTVYEGRDIGYPGSSGATIPRESRYDGALEWGAQLSRGRLDAVSARVFAQRLEHDMSVRMQMKMNGMPVTQVTDARSHSLTSGARAQFRLLPAATLSLDVGAEAVEWRAEATRVTQRVDVPNAMPTVLHTWPNARILDAGAFSQGEWRTNRRLTVAAGGRVDRITKHAEGWAGDAEWIGTGNLGAVVALGGGFRTRASYGVGYRVPDPTESFGVALRPDGYVYKGTPELRTEIARNGEMGLLLDRPVASGALAVSVTAFQNLLGDLIAPVLVPGELISGRPVRAYANVSRARMQGLTGSASLATRGGQRLSVSGQRLLGTNRVNDTPLALVPPAEATLTAHVAREWLEFHPWVEGSWRVVAGQQRVATTAGEMATPGFGTLDLRSGFTVAGARATIGVENVFDRAFREHVDPGVILRPGRNAFVRIVRSF
ncbi:MAG: TonB-dependent receptor [Gemmatimonadaceae bacterium]|jgi:hemoglobin/transferrin/lactoferrin receptor protein